MKEICKDYYKFSRDPEILGLIHESYSESNYARNNVAENPKTPISILSKLSKDKEPYVRSWVAYNNNTPIRILIKLHKDKNDTVVYWVEKNPTYIEYKNK